jgi:hypothetical protein
MGWLDVDAMLDQMTPQQWTEWQARDIVEPIGHRGTHDILAILGAIVAGLGGAKDVTPESLLHWRKKPEEQVASHEVAAMALQMIGARRNG